MLVGPDAIAVVADVRLMMQLEVITIGLGNL